MTWIRLDTGMKRDPRVWLMADALGRDVGAVVGYIANVLAEFPEHARDGDLSHVPDALLEQWAMWPGKRGVFARVFLEHLCDGRRVRAWEKHNGTALKAADASRERVRAFRDRKQAERDRANNGRAADGSNANDAQSRNANGNALRNGDGNALRNTLTGRDVTGRNVTKDKNEKDNGVLDAGASHTQRGVRPTGHAGDEPDGFADAMAAYPRRAGGNPRPKAAHAYRARLREGTPPGEILAGVERYAAYCAATGKLGTEYVQQAATFFGPGRGFAEPWDPPADEATPLDRQLEAIAAAELARYDRDAQWLAERAARQNGAPVAVPAGVGR
jgi:hypothetical protein